MTGPTSTTITTAAPRRTSRIVPLIGLLAWAAAAASAWNLIAWGNRWYVATQLLPVGPDGPAEGWEKAYDRMTLVHQSLVSGILALLVAVTLGLAWRWSSRR